MGLRPVDQAGHNVRKAGELLAVRAGRVHESSDEGFLLIHPDDVDAHRTKVTEAMERAAAYVSEYRHVREDGEVLWLEERGGAVVDGTGRTIRLVGVTLNITARKRAAEASAETAERLQVALEAAALGTFAFDPETGKADWDAQQKRIWGFSPEAEPDLPSILALVHPEDREVTARAFETALGASSDGR